MLPFEDIGFMLMDVAKMCNVDAARIVTGDAIAASLAAPDQSGFHLVASEAFQAPDGTQARLLLLRRRACIRNVSRSRLAQACSGAVSLACSIASITTRRASSACPQRPTRTHLSGSRSLTCVKKCSICWKMIDGRSCRSPTSE